MALSCWAHRCHTLGRAACHEDCTLTSMGAGRGEERIPITQLEPQVWYAKGRPIVGLFIFVSPENYLFSWLSHLSWVF